MCKYCVYVYKRVLSKKPSLVCSLHVCHTRVIRVDRLSATVQIYLCYNNRNQHYNMYEYAVNKHVCQQMLHYSLY